MGCTMTHPRHPLIVREFAIQVFQSNLLGEASWRFFYNRPKRPHDCFSLLYGDVTANARIPNNKSFPIIVLFETNIRIIVDFEDHLILRCTSYTLCQMINNRGQK